MSRCFPFPPPGYEKKPRADDESFLAKEKHKEKKRKRDKKDREKREGKEKKDRVKSEDKHREKRHKGEKDKHRVKETSEISSDKNTLGLPECHNGEKLSSNGIQSNGANEKKFLLERGKRVRDDDRDTESCKVQRISLSGQRTAQLSATVVGGSNANMVEGNEKVKMNAKDIVNGVIKKNFTVSDQEKLRSVAGLVDNSGQRTVQFPAKVGGSTGNMVEGNVTVKQSIFGQSNKVDAEDMVNGISKKKYVVSDQEKPRSVAGLVDNSCQRTAQFPAKVVGGSPGNMVEGTVTAKQSIFGPSNKVDAKDMVNGVIKKNFVVSDQEKLRSEAGLVDSSVDKRMEEKVKDKHKNSDSRGERHKDKDRERKSKSKDKKKEKKERTEKKEKKEKRKEKEPNKNQLEPRDVALNVPSNKSFPPLNESTTSAVSESILGKRKELQLNGFSHDDASRPSKLPRSLSSVHEVSGNGARMEPLKNATQTLPKWEGAVDKEKMNKNMVSPFHPNTENGRNMKVSQVSSSHPVVENGRKSVQSQVPAQLASGKQGVVGHNSWDKDKLNNNMFSSSHPVVENRRKSDQSQIPAQLASGKQGVVGNHTLNKDKLNNNMVSSSHPVVGNGRESEQSQISAELASGKQGAVGNNAWDNDKLSNNMGSSFYPNAENGRKMKSSHVSSPLPPVQNGRKLEPSQVSAQLAYGKQGKVGNHTVDNGSSFPHPVVQNDGRKSAPSQTPAQLASGKQGAVANRTADHAIPFSHSVQNGRKSEPSQTPAQLASGKHGAVVNRSVDNVIPFSHPVIRSGIRPEQCQSPAQSTSGKQVAVNRTVAPVIQNGRKSEPSQAPAQVAFGKQGVVGNCTVDKKAISFSQPVNGRTLEPRQTSAQLVVDKSFSFSKPVVENGKKIEPSQTAAQLNSGKQGIVSSHAVNKSISFSQPVQENGTKLQTSHTEAQLASEKVKASAPIKDKEKVKVPPKPHPDLKYLSKIYSVPKVEWDHVDDLEWLSCSNTRKEKPSVGTEEPEQVWAKALHLESADVIALPYVIPY